MPVASLPPSTVREQLSDAGGRMQLVDVREPWEFDRVHLDDAQLIPLAELPSRYREIDASRPVVLYCHHGIRSWHAACFLSHHGFEQVINLEGGIDAWARELDDDLLRY